VQPVSLVDIMSFLQMLIVSFQDPLYLAFVLLLTFAVLFNVKRLFVDGLL